MLCEYSHPLYYAAQSTQPRPLQHSAGPLQHSAPYLLARPAHSLLPECTQIAWPLPAAGLAHYVMRYAYNL